MAAHADRPRPVTGSRGVGGRVRRAGAEVGEELVDHGRLREERDDPHRAVAGGTRERVALDKLLQQGRPPAGGRSRPHYY